jgi:putative FmdB family regulatory protein
MPIYEYSCKKCGAHMEVMQKISDKPLARHAKCGGKLEKEWSRTGFQFKGSGWYVTDYAAKKSDAKEGKEPKTDASSKADSSSKTDASSKSESSSKTDSSSTSAGAESKGEAKKKKGETKPASTSGGGE